MSALVAGQSHTCGVPPGGHAYCWGWNYFGQLGDSTTTDRLTPVPVAGGLSLGQVDAGGYHTCGIAAGAAYCWGNYNVGTVGDGTTTHRLSPVRVFPPPSP